MQKKRRRRKERRKKERHTLQDFFFYKQVIIYEAKLFFHPFRAYLNAVFEFSLAIGTGRKSIQTGKEEGGTEERPRRAATDPLAGVMPWLGLLWLLFTYV